MKYPNPQIKINPNAHMARDIDYVVCHLVEERPDFGQIAGTDIPATIERCSGCNRGVWVSPTSPRTPPLICRHCIKKYVKEDPEPDSGITWLGRQLTPEMRQIIEETNVAHRHRKKE